MLSSRRRQAKDVFYALYDFLKSNGLLSDDCVGVSPGCLDVATSCCSAERMQNSEVSHCLKHSHYFCAEFQPHAAVSMSVSDRSGVQTQKRNLWSCLFVGNAGGSYPAGAGLMCLTWAGLDKNKDTAKGADKHCFKGLHAFLEESNMDF